MLRCTVALTAVGVACLLAAGRAAADGKDEIIKILTKELQAQREDLARLREENRQLRAEVEKLRKAAATGGPRANVGTEDKKPANKLHAALLGEWKTEAGETYIFKEKGEYVRKLPPVLNQGPITTVGKYRFLKGDRVLNENMIELLPQRTNAAGFGATGELLQRRFHVEVEDDEMILEQRAPLPTPRQRFMRKKNDE